MSPPVVAGLAQALSARGALKSAGVIAVTAGIASALVLPGAPPTALALGAVDPTTASQRTSALAVAGTSRSGGRGADSAAARVAAPAAPVARPAYGVEGITAVVRPEVAALDPDLVHTVRYSTTEFAAQGRAKGLVLSAQRAYSAVRSAFGLTDIGGLRPGDPLDHGTGHAIDVMITDKAVGDAVAAFMLAHADELNVKYVIWQQRSWKPERGTWRLMEDRGSITQNHYDHVHISVS